MPRSLISKVVHYVEHQIVEYGFRYDRQHRYFVKQGADLAAKLYVSVVKDSFKNQRLEGYVHLLALDAEKLIARAYQRSNQMKDLQASFSSYLPNLARDLDVKDITVMAGDDAQPAIERFADALIKYCIPFSNRYHSLNNIIATLASDVLYIEGIDNFHRQELLLSLYVLDNDLNAFRRHVPVALSLAKVYRSGYFYDQMIQLVDFLEQTID